MITNLDTKMHEVNKYKLEYKFILILTILI